MTIAPIHLPVFALGFGAPALLWGTGLAATPLILHLLFRRKYRQMNWAAMKWLLDAMKKNHRRLRLEQWLLLAVRTLLILLVVLAMARPALDSPNPLLAAASSSAVHNVIVFDNSMSMLHTAGTQSRWERAKGLAQAILDDSQKGDLASLVVMGMPATAVVGDASPYLVAVSEEIDAITPQHGVAEIEPAMDLVSQILAKSSASRKRVYLITDMQRHTWMGSKETTQVSDLAEKLRSISSTAQFQILDVGTEAGNVAVTAVEQSEPVAVARRATIIRADITNFTQTVQNDIRAEILVDGQVEGTQRLDLPAGETRAVNFGLTFTEQGERVIEVRTQADGLPADDHRWLVAPVRNSLSVLLIDGQPSGEPFRSETDYLRVALSPEDEDGQPGLIRAEVRLESDLLDANLDEWDMVALCNVSQLTASELAVLQDYLNRGGGVLFFLGSQTNIAAFNQMLFDDGKGILPAQLSGFVGDLTNKQEHFSFDPLNYAHSLVVPFKDHEQAGLLSTKIFRYMKVQLPEETSAQVPLAFDSKDPAIVLANHGKGMVGLITTTADLDWNTWPISPSYVPLIQELTLQLVAGRVQREQFRVGQSLALPAPGKQQQVQATLLPPGDEAPTAIRSQEIGGISVFQFDQTDLSGVYRITVNGSDQSLPVPVNTWPEESDLTRLVPEDLRATFPGWEFTISDRFQSPRSATASATRHNGEIFRLLLYAALALAFVETFFAYKFGHHAG